VAEEGSSFQDQIINKMFQAEKNLARIQDEMHLGAAQQIQKGHCETNSNNHGEK